MLNQDKYKTAEERVKAFRNFCKRDCKNCVLLHSGGGEFESVNNCWAYWLALPVEEEKPMPCPFCGGEVEVQAQGGGKDRRGNVYLSLVRCRHCGYESRSSSERDSIGAIIVAHNRVCRAVEAAKKTTAKERDR